LHLLLFMLAVIAISITNLRVGLILQALACGPGYGDILEATFFSNVAPVTRAGLLVNVESWLPYHWHLICTTGDGPVHRARVTISESGLQGARARLQPNHTANVTHKIEFHIL
jgi:hypothetical protein